jgi:hypothetical protein
MNETNEQVQQPNTSTEKRASSTNTVFHSKKLPLSFDRERYRETDFLLINITARIVWLVRLISPAAWILAFFQNQPNKSPSYYTSHRATEVYQLTAVLIPMFIFSASSLIAVKSKICCKFDSVNLHPLSR